MGSTVEKVARVGRIATMAFGLALVLVFVVIPPQ